MVISRQDFSIGIEFTDKKLPMEMAYRAVKHIRLHYSMEVSY
jgi:ribulose bisphosphate carboxylase small subunit